MSESQNSSPQDEKGSKELKIDRERKELLARVASSELSNTRHRVAWLLNQFLALGTPTLLFRLSTGRYLRRILWAALLMWS